MAVGRHLSRLGVLGRFAQDFVVVRDATGTWTPYAIQLNLRKGGTTHPFLTLQFLTDGAYDGDHGLFLTPTGTPLSTWWRPTISSTPGAARLTGDDLFEIVATHRPALRPRPPDGPRGVPHDQRPVPRPAGSG